MKKKIKNKTTDIPVFFAVDDNYARYLGVAIRSLADNLDGNFDCSIYVLIDELSNENKQKLKELETENVKIAFVNVASRLDSLSSKIHLRDYYTKATYYRFFIPELFPEYDKGIYLDCDMLVNGDVSELYRVDVRGLLVAAAKEEVMANVEVFRKYAEEVVGVPCEQYFNAGMLVMNLAEMRRIRIEEEFAELLSERAFRVTQDQDYLNVICSGKSLIVSQNWNKTAYFGESGADVKIAHFKINYKPWRYEGVMCEEDFWRYALLTPYYRELVEEKKNYGEAERKRDAQAYANLMELAKNELEEYYGTGFDYEASPEKAFGA